MHNNYACMHTTEACGKQLEVIHICLNVNNCKPLNCTSREKVNIVKIRHTTNSKIINAPKIPWQLYIVVLFLLPCALVLKTITPPFHMTINIETNGKQQFYIVHYYSLCL